MSEFTDKSGKKYILGKRLGTPGAEGTAFEIEGNPGLAAKIYHDSELTEGKRQYHQKKIETMLSQPVESRINNVLSIAWPKDMLFNSEGKFAGFVMPKVESSYHIYDASRKRSREALFPHYTWKVAITIAYNLALAVEKVHSAGAVVGDFNPDNFMLDEKGHITLIDTDGYTIQNRKTGVIFKCKKGYPEVLAPELQGRDLSLETSVFTEQSDNFSLAIHIFKLLMNNNSPFNCVVKNGNQKSISNNPEERNITRGECPYIKGDKTGVPVDAPDFSMLPYQIRELFTRAFSYNVNTAVQNDTIFRRPTAGEWKNALKKIHESKLKTCLKDSSHVYSGNNSECPWCKIEKRLREKVTAIGQPAKSNKCQGKAEKQCNTSGGPVKNAGQSNGINAGNSSNTVTAGSFPKINSSVKPCSGNVKKKRICGSALIAIGAFLLIANFLNADFMLSFYPQTAISISAEDVRAHFILAIIFYTVNILTLGSLSLGNYDIWMCWFVMLNTAAATLISLGSEEKSHFVWAGPLFVINTFLCVVYRNLLGFTASENWEVFIITSVFFAAAAIVPGVIRKQL